MLNTLHSTAGAACMGNSGMIAFRFFPHIFLHSFFIIGGSFSLHKGNCTCRAGWQTISQTITIIISQKCCFAVYHADCTLVTSFGTRTTSVTFFFIYLDNSSNHVHSVLSLVFLGIVYYT